MKKGILAVCIIAIMFMVVPAWSAPIDTILGRTYLSNSSVASEDTWVSGILGESVTQFYRDGSDQSPFGGGILKSLDGWNPGFAWEYALVKVDGPNDFSYLFMDDNGTSSILNGDDLLTTGAQGSTNHGFLFNAGNGSNNGYGISHVSYYGGSTQVPEPATLLLLGLGLVGLAGVSKKLKK